MKSAVRRTVEREPGRPAAPPPRRRTSPARRAPRARASRLRVPSASATRGPAAASVRPRRLLSHAAALPRRRNATAQRWPDRFFRAGGSRAGGSRGGSSAARVPARRARAGVALTHRPPGPARRPRLQRPAGAHLASRAPRSRPGDHTRSVGPGTRAPRLTAGAGGDTGRAGPPGGPDSWAQSRREPEPGCTPRGRGGGEDAGWTRPSLPLSLQRELRGRGEQRESETRRRARGRERTHPAGFWFSDPGSSQRVRRVAQNPHPRRAHSGSPMLPPIPHTGQQPTPCPPHPQHASAEPHALWPAHLVTWRCCGPTSQGLQGFFQGTAHCGQMGASGGFPFRKEKVRREGSLKSPAPILSHWYSWSESFSQAQGGPTHTHPAPGDQRPLGPGAPTPLIPSQDAATKLGWTRGIFAGAACGSPVASLPRERHGFHSLHFAVGETGSWKGRQFSEAESSRWGEPGLPPAPLLSPQA